MAPLAANRSMFRKEDTIYSAKTVGVPGTVRGLALAHQRFGRLPWKEVVLPAVHLAEDGFLLDACLASSLNGIVTVSGDASELRRVLGQDGGTGSWHAGHRFVQREHGRTL